MTTPLIIKFGIGYSDKYVPYTNGSMMLKLHKRLLALDPYDFIRN